MKISSTAGPSLIFYTGAHNAGSAHPVTHGQTGQLAASSASWTYRSVAMSGMQAFISSTVNTGDASVVYLGHQEDMVTVSQDDLTMLYPSSDQFPLNYLGLDPTLAVVVWLDVDAVQAAPNAVASFAQVGGSITSLTTLSLPGRRGVLGFAGTNGNLVAATCPYGDYHASSGMVDWSGQSGVVVMQYTGGKVTLISVSGFPDGWMFSEPRLQGDGSWVVTLNAAVPASDTIASVTANPDSIVDDGISASVIAASVVGSDNLPAAGVTVHWGTTLGSVTPLSSVTGSDGKATTTLTDNGIPGMATVTASLDNGSQGNTSVTVTDSTAGHVIVMMTSDKNSIENDGVDVAQLTATVHDAQGNPAQGVPVYWRTSLGTLSHAEQDTNASGQSQAKLTDLGDTGTAEVTTLLDNGDYQTYLVTLVPATAALDLYQQAGYQGTSIELSEHESATLRSATYYWNYDSAKMAGARLLSYTVYGQEDSGYDYRTYQDDYSADDVPDISLSYTGTSPEIQGVALGENDVVVRVHLVPNDATQRVVLSASQWWPKAFTTAALNADGMVNDGVLVVFDRTQPSTVIPVQVGLLNEDGTADWQIETSVTAAWDTSLQQPVLTLAGTAPDDWSFFGLQATSETGEYYIQLTSSIPSTLAWTGGTTALNPLKNITINENGDFSVQTIPVGARISRAFTGGTAPYVFASTAPDIASVDSSGTVTIKGKGRATITLTDSRENTIMYSINTSNRTVIRQQSTSQQQWTGGLLSSYTLELCFAEWGDFFADANACGWSGQSASDFYFWSSTGSDQDPWLPVKMAYWSVNFHVKTEDVIDYPNSYHYLCYPV